MVQSPWAQLRPAHMGQGAQPHSSALAHSKAMRAAGDRKPAERETGMCANMAGKSTFPSPRANPSMGTFLLSLTYSFPICSLLSEALSPP